jgi:opacity protein-like surface antigen
MIKHILAVAGLAGIVSPAVAQEGPYVAGAVGYTFPENIDSSVGLEAEIEGGYSVIGAGGYDFEGFRVELEGSYRTSGVGQARAAGLSVEGDGDVSALSAMANVYIGAGAGISRFKAEDVEAVGVAGFGPVSASETGFAYQFMAGAGLRISEQATLTAGYRYFATPSIETTIDPLGSVEIDGLGLHSVEVGIRARF